MINIDKQIIDIDRVICGNISTFGTIGRGLLSQNILSQLRNFIEHVSLKAMSGQNDIDDSYDNIQTANQYIKTRGELSFLRKFHKLLQISASHYTLEEENSERLMLKYYEYLLKIKDYLYYQHGLTVLSNIDDFPINLDRSLIEYHEKIAERVDVISEDGESTRSSDRYYMHSIKPFFVAHKVYYEVTFCNANNRASKFDRVIAFTSLDIPDNYAVKLSLVDAHINILDKQMPIKVIDKWEVSIRPCEFDNFARILNKSIKVQSSHAEYRELMRYLTKTGLNLVELLLSEDHYYQAVRDQVIIKAQVIRVFDIFDNVRELVKNNSPGSNVVRYLLIRLNNRIIKDQYISQNCIKLSGLCLKYGCIPFDQMPFNSSLMNHNPRISDVMESIDVEGREHELLARLINHNVEYRGELYTPIKDLSKFENVDRLIKIYNGKLYRTHQHRRLEVYSDNIYIKGYEEDTFHIIQKLRELVLDGLDGYANSVKSWLKTSSYNIDSPEKKEALERLFEDSKVALIYGAAGTGKSTMIKHISSYFNDKEKLFLTNTNPAIDNLRRNIIASNCTFKTITKHLSPSNEDRKFDVLIIDECSTVSNSDLVKVLDQTEFKLLVLVGDIYQIESIHFGNWFSAVRFFIPKTSIFELTEPFRTKNESLLRFWGKVRNIEDDVLEQIARNGYSTSLDASIFNNNEDDEIILCLNYDGLYGINNVNRFLQSSNNSTPVKWGISTYKVGDPILFNELERFKPVIYNNLKGKIKGISLIETGIQFDIEIDKAINELDIIYLELDLISSTDDGKSVIRLVVYKNKSTDEDDDSLNTIVPFQVAYAVSIHKAQGLEYDSVKVVITDEIDEKVTHNIFYTAITRARSKLKIYWSPEVGDRIIGRLEHKINRRDVVLLSNKYGLDPDFSE